MDFDGGKRVFNRLGPAQQQTDNRNQKVCYHWRAGNCNRFPCPFLHREISAPVNGTASSKRPYSGGLAMDDQRSTGGRRGGGNTWGRYGGGGRGGNGINNEFSKMNNNGINKKEKICNFWVKGSCTFGDKCRYIHSWSTGSFGMLTHLEGHQKIVSGIALPAGSDKLYTGSKDETVRVWDCQSGQCAGVINVGGEVGCMLSEGPWMFVGLPNLVKAWNVQTNAELSLSGPVGQVYSLVAGSDLQNNTNTHSSRSFEADMDPKLTEVAQTFERFKAALVRNDFDTCSRLLSQLKVNLIEFTSLPPLFAETPNASQELTIARDIYEHAVVLSVKMEDQDEFERNFFQLKPYYTDGSNRLTQSPQEYPILGLNLLRLLVQNRIAEFHTELELLSASALENPCIKHAVELEQSFMEGAYNRVLSARQTVPHETYVYFMDLLARTVRDEIAGCSEKAYDSLTVKDARQMLLLSSDQELFEYIKEEHPEWEVKNGLVVFQKAKDSAPCKEIPSLQLINQTLSYARELERIV